MSIFLSVGRLEVETRDLPGHVRFDPGGIVNYCGDLDGPPVKGGHVSIRYGRSRAIEITFWSELAHDVGQALNAWFWRRAER